MSWSWRTTTGRRSMYPSLAAASVLAIGVAWALAPATRPAVNLTSAKLTGKTTTSTTNPGRTAGFVLDHRRYLPVAPPGGFEASASRLGLSRSEYARRRLAQDAAAGAAVTTGDLARFAETIADLDDPAVMSRAWR